MPEIAAKIVATKAVFREINRGERSNGIVFVVGYWLLVIGCWLVALYSFIAIADGSAVNFHGAIAKPHVGMRLLLLVRPITALHGLIQLLSISMDSI